MLIVLRVSLKSVMVTPVTSSLKFRVTVPADVDRGSGETSTKAAVGRAPGTFPAATVNPDAVVPLVVVLPEVVEAAGIATGPAKGRIGAGAAAGALMESE